MTSYPPNGTKIAANVVQWDDRWFVAVDDNGLPYIHWFEDDARWNNIWLDVERTGNLRVMLRAGRTDGPRGRKAFMIEVLDAVVLPKPQRPAIPFDASNDGPRSMYDVVSKQLDVTMENIVESIEESKPEAKPPAKKFRAVCHVSIEEDGTNLQYVAAEMGLAKTFVANKCLEVGIKPMLFLACGGKV